MSDLTNPLEAKAKKLDVDPFITTRSGVRFRYARFTEDDIVLMDIANHLAIINRWCGATYNQISVGQHSTMMAQYAMGEAEPSQFPNGLKDSLDYHRENHDKHSEKIVRKQFARALLLHDAEEYVTNDLASPLKVFFPEFRKYGDHLRQRIFEKYDLCYDTWYPHAKAWDRRMLFNEAEWGMNGGRKAISEGAASATVATLGLKIQRAWNIDETAEAFIRTFARTL